MGGGGFSPGGIGLGGLGRKTSKATVVIDARIVDMGPGRFLAVGGERESKRSGLMLGAAVGGGGGLVAAS